MVQHYGKPLIFYAFHVWSMCLEHKYPAWHTAQTHCCEGVMLVYNRNQDFTNTLTFRIITKQIR